MARRSSLRARSLRADERGATLVEFALILPALLLVICATIEVGHLMFARVVLEGAVTEAARIAVASQESTQDARDAAMRKSIKDSMNAFPLAAGRVIAIQTTVYANFSTAYPEPYTDANGNGKYDNGETYVDRNKSGKWDNATPIAGTLGGPGDVVSFSVSYPKRVLFGFIASQIGMSRNAVTLSATTVVRNESVARP